MRLKGGNPIGEGYFIPEKRYQELVKNYGKPSKGDILLTAVGTLGISYMVGSEEFYFKDGNIIWFKNFIDKNLNIYLYSFMQSQNFKELIDEITIGSTQSAITINTLGKQSILIPERDTLANFCEKVSIFVDRSANVKEQKLKCIDLRKLLLSKMTLVDIDKKKLLV